MLLSLWPPAIMFRCRRFFLSLVFLFTAANLGGCFADRHQTLPCVRWWPRFTIFVIKIRKQAKNLVCLAYIHCRGLWRNCTERADNVVFSFAILLQIYRKYLHNATRYYTLCFKKLHPDHPYDFDNNVKWSTTAVDQWRKRPHCCAETSGRHFEHLL